MDSREETSFRSWMTFVVAGFLVLALATVYFDLFVPASPLEWWKVTIIVLLEAFIFVGAGYQIYGMSDGPYKAVL